MAKKKEVTEEIEEKECTGTFVKSSVGYYVSNNTATHKMNFSIMKRASCKCDKCLRLQERFLEEPGNLLVNVNPVEDRKEYQLVEANEGKFVLKDNS